MTPSEYVCDVLPLKKRDCVDGYTHRAQVFRLNPPPERVYARTLILTQRGNSAENARLNLFIFAKRASVRDKELVVAAIEAAGKEAVSE